MKKITPVMMNKHSVMHYTPLDIRTERNALIAASDNEVGATKIRSAKSHRRRKEPSILSPSPRGKILTKDGAQKKRRCYGAQSVTERKLRRRSRKSEAAVAAAGTPDASHFDFKTDDGDDKLVNNRKKREKSSPSDIESCVDSRQAICNTKGERGHGVDELKSDVGFDDSGSDDDSFPIIQRFISSTRKRNRLFILEDDESEDDWVNGDSTANKITAKKGSNDADRKLKSINKHCAHETATDSNREKVAPKIASQISDSEENNSNSGTRRTHGNESKSIRKVSTTKKSVSVLSSKAKKPSSLQKKKAIMVGKAAAARSPYVAEAYTRAAASLVTESRNEIIGKTITKSARPQNKCFEFPEEEIKYVDGIDGEGSTGDASSELREEMSDGSSAYFPSYSGDDVAADERVNPHPRKSLARKKNAGDMDCASRNDHRSIVEERGKNLPCQQKPKFEESQQVIDPTTDYSHNHVFDDDFRISFNRHVVKQPCGELKTITGKNAFLHWNCDESGENSKAFDEDNGGRGDQYFERNSGNGSLDDYDQDSNHAEDNVARKYLSNIYTQLEDPVVGGHGESDESGNEIYTSKQCEINRFVCDSPAKKHASEKDGGHSKGNKRSSNNFLELETRSSSANSDSQNSQAKTIKIASSKEDALIVANEVKLHHIINGQTLLDRRKKHLGGIDRFGNGNEPVTNLEGNCSKKNDIMDMNDCEHHSYELVVKRSAGVKNEEFIDSGDEYQFVEFNTRNISKVDPEALVAALQTQPIEFVQSTQLSRAIESSNTYDEFPGHNLPINAQLTSPVPEAEITNAHISVTDKFRELENLLSRSIEIMHEIKSSIPVEWFS